MLLYWSVFFKPNCLETYIYIYMCENCKSGWTFILIVVLETPLRLHCLLIPLLNPLMGFDWLLFLLVCWFSYLPLSGCSVRNITLRIWVWYHFSSMVSVYSVFLNLKQCLLKSVWTLLTFLTQIRTCKSSSRQKNGFLFYKESRLQKNL